jgi:hypothetical protein
MAHPHEQPGGTKSLRQCLQSCRTVGPMIHQPQAPSNYMGTRITICAVLGLIVTGFFIVYDAMVHRGAPSLPVSQASYRERAVERGSEEVKVPDMKSAGVAFASADVSPPAQFQSAQNLLGTLRQMRRWFRRNVRYRRSKFPDQSGRPTHEGYRPASLQSAKKGARPMPKAFLVSLRL